MPPVTKRVSFNIRKHSPVIYTLDDYVAHGVMTSFQQEILKKAIQAKQNILISGSPAAGKTTFVNALLHELENISPFDHRVLILEQVPELQCSLPNCKVLHTSDHISMNQLLWLAMRNSPERIIVGEVRDGAALDLLKAWNTGCAGGFATIHANHPAAAMQRLMDLAGEVTTTPPYQLAAEAIDMIVQIQSNPVYPAGRTVSSIATVKGFNAKQQQFMLKEMERN